MTGNAAGRTWKFDYSHLMTTGIHPGWLRGMEKAAAGILKERPRPKNERLVLPWMWVRPWGALGFALARIWRLGLVWCRFSIRAWWIQYVLVLGVPMWVRPSQCQTHTAGLLVSSGTATIWRDTFDMCNRSKRQVQ